MSLRAGRTSWPAVWADEDAAPKPHDYYLRVRPSGETAMLPHNRAPAEGNLAWSSPVWLEVG